MLVMERLRPAVLLLSLAVIYCQGQGDVCNNEILDSCDLCINESPECVWCPLTTVNDDIMEQFPDVENIRCRNRDSLFHQNRSCESPLQDPRSSSNITVDEELSVVAEVGVPTVQVSPQNIVLNLRRGEPVSFNMTFRSLRNTPLDVYFLFDFSASLAPIINTLRDNVITIANSLETISAAYALGLGTFVDKPTLPFATTSNTEFADENSTSANTVCRAGIPEPCIPAYGYRHFLSLIQDVNAFTDAISSSSISGNLDSIEGGLDAVLQAAVCNDIVGWRSEALRMLFYVSDQGYHLAGDGRLSGSYRPNDGQCHLEQRTLSPGTDVFEYTSSIEQDYPSIRQLRDAMIEANIVPIFVIRSSNRSAASNLAPYKALALSLMDVSADVRQLDRQRQTDITTLEEVIRDSYERTTQRVIPNDPGIDGYTFTFDPIEGCETFEEGACIVQFGDDVVFNVTVTLDSCDDASVRDNVKLVRPPFTFSTLKLVPQCACDCSDDPVSGPDVCDGFGVRICGVCICTNENGTRYGDECQCENEIQACPQGDNMDCSGQGKCDDCGICECDPGFFGDACECSYSNCPMGAVDDGVLLNCTGRGDCVCRDGREVCECDDALVTATQTYEYFSPSVGLDGTCECDPNGCYNNRSMVLCATLGVGTFINNEDICRCSGCLCPRGLLNLDNICISMEQACIDQEKCAQCSVQESPSSDCEMCNLDNFRTFGLEETLPDDYRVMCNFQLSGCTYTFYLSETTVDAEVLISDDINCPLGALPWIIAGSLVGAIVLLGILALILLKLLFVFLDRIEYRKFTKELQQADFAPHENPLYLNPQQDYQNPLRRQTKRDTQ